jgi:precorrin-8X/cobalt-precorrin-8 methylmutase
MSRVPAPKSNSLVNRYALSPEQIEQQSLERVSSRVRGQFAGDAEQQVAARVLYAAGDVELLELLRFSDGAVGAGIDALTAGSTIIADVRMVLAGLDGDRARALGCDIRCAIDDPRVIDRARASATTRAVEAMRLLAPQLDGGIAVIGNAPTALLCLLDLVDGGTAVPSIIIGMPVGFTAAAEAKAELMHRSIPFLTIEGTRGGSALAAAALNAMLRLATPQAPAAADRSHTALLFVGHGSRAPDAAEAMLAAVEGVRKRGLFPIVESGYLELSQPDLPDALRSCVERGAKRVLVIPYFLNNGMHIRRDIPNVLQGEAGNYSGVRITIGRPIGLQADFANVMIAGALEAEQIADLDDKTEPETGDNRPAANAMSGAASRSDGDE